MHAISIVNTPANRIPDCIIANDNTVTTMNPTNIAKKPNAIQNTINLIKNTIHLSEKEIMTAFSNLSDKNLIKTDVIKKGNKIEESINLDNIYNLMYMDINEEVKNESNNNIFETFEQEFARTLSPTEYEIINAWIDAGVSEELIIGALKEATYNGVTNLRYIDKIIYEWNKKGFKSMEDVNKHIKNKDKKEFTDDGFDYNWLDDSE